MIQNKIEESILIKQYIEGFVKRTHDGTPKHSSHIREIFFKYMEKNPNKIIKIIIMEDQENPNFIESQIFVAMRNLGL